MQITSEILRMRRTKPSQQLGVRSQRLHAKLHANVHDKIMAPLVLCIDFKPRSEHEECFDKALGGLSGGILYKKALLNPENFERILVQDTVQSMICSCLLR